MESSGPYTDTNSGGSFGANPLRQCIGTGEAHSSLIQWKFIGLLRTVRKYLRISKLAPFVECPRGK